MAFLEMDIPKAHSIGYLLKLIEESGKVQVPESLKEVLRTLIIGNIGSRITVVTRSR